MSANRESERRYNAVPYLSKPYAETHPDRLSTVAKLLGHPAPEVRGCRVLEIGCGLGGNLVPMAASLADCQFYGFDLSPVQIDIARRLASDVGVDNVQFEVGDIQQVRSLGSFDFVIAHGVYSWVPPDVRDSLLAMIHRCLRPNGVGFVSYNTFPGWGTRAPVKDLMVFAGRHQTEPSAVVASARAALTMASSLAPQGAHRDILRQHEDLLKTLPDGYVFHDFLSHVNDPVWFSDFVVHVGRHGLNFLGEANFSDVMGGDLHPDALPILAGVGDRIRREQYKDFLKNRGFRESLLVRSEVAPDHQPSAEHIAAFWVNALVEPVGDVDLSEGVEVDFRDREGRVFGTSRPMLKAALLELAAARPGNMPVEELLQRARARLGRRVGQLELEDRQILLKNLFFLYTKKLCDLQQRSFVSVATLSERPRAWAPARVAALAGAHYIPNCRHESVVLEGRFERALLGLLDGNRTRGQLVDELVGLCLEGVVTVRAQSGEPVTDKQTLRQAMLRGLPSGLEMLRLLAMLDA